ncbi:nicotinic acid mononucleotide adenyltransferase [Psychroserpens sp.]|uniref:nicotinic acid mononucleotide adenyltransferase n=1 Tax=Psychroserpens sp. TaxID=2020870 RepID=UPI002B267F73|nr:nicotinic acid mononucleotide adenyltransferase [Psychroserpens sp.]
MKTIKILLGFVLSATLLTSCYTEEVIINDFDNQPGISLNQLLGSYELWYVDINQTLGPGETPFLQIAFTMSFRNGLVYANNNLVGFGNQGGGFGIDVGTYDAYNMILDIYHDIDGYQTFDVYQIDNNTIELYNPYNDTSYFLNGYQRSNFDYDYVFYDNIHYFLQEYEAWEKTYTSQMGMLNEFDNENYLQFLAGGNDSEFRSSQDSNIGNPNNIYWAYTGVYGVGNISNNMYLKTLTLDYDFFDNEFFELSVINDQRIELYHPTSNTVYEFTGRGYIQFLRETDAEGRKIEGKKELKKRKQKTAKKENPRVNKRS